MQKFLTIAFVALLSLQMAGCSIFKKNKKSPTPTAATMAKRDTTKRAAPMPPGEPKPYKEVITSKAITSKGMFITHKVDDKYYFEIPNELLGRDILVVARLSKAAAGVRIPMVLSYAGDMINSNTVRFEKGPNNRVYLKSTSFQEISKDSTDGMYHNVMNSNLQPIAASFDVKAWGTNKASSVIDVTAFISGDNEYFFFAPQVKKQSGVGGLQPDKSYVLSTKAYPSNVEIKTVKTYGVSPKSPMGGPGGESSPATFELNTSLVLLPKVPMQPRYYDDRVGYFNTQTITDFDMNPQGVDRYSYVARYRLEPKTEDIEKYKRGELVEPKKQIIYYIDPTTPKKWVPYLIQGVNDWQVAFEQAGFKNAIVAKMAPTYQEDSTFNLEDASHSAIIYKPSDIANASGPNVHDPRSGEIMESHINWFHNVMSLLQNWYMVQASSVDSRARKMKFDDELMGELIRFVSSHEVGHTLGLRHNFGSSSTVPVEKLRDKAWAEANGHTPSIMDYARFNYVAQPEDNISEKGVFPRIGDYDKWAIEWGYRWFPEVKSADQEVPVLNKLTIERLKNPRNWWGDGEGFRDDPRSQTEDLSDNAMKASTYGIKNLKRLLQNLPQYTWEANKDYTNLETMYTQVLGQFGRYIGHVSANIGGVERTQKKVEQSGPVYEFTNKETQKEAIQWLATNVFTTPSWIIEKDYLQLTGQSALPIIAQAQGAALSRLISGSTLGKLIKFESEAPAKAYSPSEMLNDVRTSIFSELASRKSIDIYRRQLQKIYVNGLIRLIEPPKAPPQAMMGGHSGGGGVSSSGASYSDITSIVKGQLRLLSSQIKAAANSSDTDTKNHLLDVRDRIEQALDPK